VQFFLLGPLEVRKGGRILVASRKQRALLAALLLRRNTVVSADELVDALWERPPRTAHASLLNHVGRLRRGLASELLETAAPGYRLRTRSRDVDHDRFLDLLRAGRESDAQRRAELLRQADLLWRGRVLADVLLFGSFAEEVEALDELRLETLEERVEADLEAGRHRELVPELEALAAQHPLRERLLEQLMVALYRSGRQADALDTYRAARRRLVEELGLDPGTALVRLERAILAHDLPLSTRTRRDAPPSLLTKTVELAPGTYAEKAEFAFRLGTALRLMGERDYAREVFEEAGERAELARVRHITLRVKLELEVDRVHREAATLTETLAFARRAAAEFDELEDDLGAALALFTCGALHRGLGHIEQAVQDFRRAVGYGRRAVGTSWPTGMILAVEGESLFLGPMPVEDAIRRCDEILDSVEWGPPGPVGVYCSLGMLHAMRGEFVPARAYVRRAAVACEEYGLLTLRAGWVTHIAAAVEELAGELVVAEELLRQGYGELASAKAPGIARLVAGAHARVLALLARGDEARDMAQVAEPRIEGDLTTKIQWLRAEALLRAATGDTAGALARAEEAVREASASDLLPLNAETMLDLASVLAAAGRSDEALASAASARLLFEQKEHLVGIERARRFTPRRRPTCH
jgi:DNA-binding SARP family transcriptional activator